MYYPHAFTERIHSQNELLKQHLMISAVPIEPDSEQHSHPVGSNHRTWCRFFLRSNFNFQRFNMPKWDSKHHIGNTIQTWNHIIKKRWKYVKMAITIQKRITVYKTAINNQIYISKKTKVQQQLVNIKDEILHQQMDYELSHCFPTPRCRCQSVHMRECLGIRSFLWLAWDTERAVPRLPHWGLVFSRKTLLRVGIWFSFKLMSAYTNYHESHVPSKVFFSWTE